MPKLLRLVNATLFLMLLGAIAVADDGPPVEPPGPDETLIYVMRESRMLGAGVGHWIAINDKTVGSLRSDTHAIFRYPAGLITLNIASAGASAASIALDNRGGETVYLEYKLGATEFIELDEKAAQKLIRKTELKEPLLEVEPNNEQMVVLMNLSRLGFDVMEPAAALAEPDADHAVVTIFRQKDGDKFDFGIWNEDGFVGTLGAREAINLRLEPGSHFFMAGNLGYTQMLADVEAGRRYHAWLDYGGWVGRVRLTPVPATDARELEKLLSKVSYVTLGPGVESDSIRARERMVTDYVREVAEKARAGSVDFTVLGAESAFP